MNSPGHRANILNPRFRQIGIGMALGNPAGADGGGATYASAFGAIGSSGKRRAQEAPVAAARGAWDRRPRRG